MAGRHRIENEDDLDWAIQWAFVHEKIRNAADDVRPVNLSAGENLVLMRAINIMMASPTRRRLLGEE